MILFRKVYLNLFLRLAILCKVAKVDIKKIIILAVGLAVFQAIPVKSHLNNLWGVQGVALASFEFQFSTPIVLISTNDLNSQEGDLAYGDKILKQVTFPFFIGANLGYILQFNKLHSLLGNISFRYSDDPINFLFDSTISSKLQTPSFTSKNISTSFLLRYNRFFSPTLSYSASLLSLINLTKDSSFDFGNNIYNFYTFGHISKLTIHSIANMRFDVDLGYSYSYFPNGDLESRIGSDGLTEYPKTEKDFQTVNTSFNYVYYFARYMQLGFKYDLGIDFYLTKPIHNGDVNNPQILDQNERVFRHSARLNFLFGFFERNGYRLLELSLSYLLKYYDSNYVELVSYSTGQAGDLASKLANSPQVGTSQFVYYQKDFKDYVVNIGAINSYINFSQKHQLVLGYSISGKNFLAAYGRYGAGESQYEYGAFRADKRLDFSQTISLGYVFSSEDKTKSISPYFGLLIGSSNDATVNRNRHIYFIGLKGVYEI